MKYQHRILEHKLLEYCDYFPVVAVNGPRQAGKSTLLHHTLKNYKYITFDNNQNIQHYHDDPEQFIRLYNDKVIFDEIQKVPELFDTIKLCVDRDREACGKFILAGSHQFSLSKNISESLAGRIGNLTLLPYEFTETPKKHIYNSIYMGAFPELVKKDYKLFNDWYASYIETYLEKDLRDLSNIGNLRDFQKLIQLLATNVGQLLNYSNYARKLAVDVKTIQKWISILEASFVIFLLPPYYNNLGKRIVKSPKIYFYDTGLVSHLCGISNQEVFEKGPMLGQIFENYIVTECLKFSLHRKDHSKLYFYRDSNGVEVDLIIDYKTYKSLIEIKTTETFKPRMLKPIESIKSVHDQAFIVYRGKDIIYGDNTSILNYKNFLGNR